MASTLIRQIRLLGFLEAVSFLLLLGIAMPLKHLAGMPDGVRVIGMIHGLLFAVYAAAIVHAMVTLRWSIGRALRLIGAGLLPFGPFLADARLRAEQRSAERDSPAAPIAAARTL